jgi:hypothetical protein
MKLNNMSKEPNNPVPPEFKPGLPTPEDILKDDQEKERLRDKFPPKDVKLDPFLIKLLSKDRNSGTEL